jgi:glycosyltransferase involved in cell wall biosynthesis
MAIRPSPAVLVYDDSAYQEARQPTPTAGPDAPHGLVGRQVAGREFLDAYLRHGQAEEVTALVYQQASADSLARWCAEHRRRLRIITIEQFLESFFPTPPAPVLYSPCPPDPAFAWARHHAGPGVLALCGVTHTLCTAGAVRVLCEMVTAPYEEWDALVCTSRAVVGMVRALSGAYADYLRDRHGGDPRLRLRLETIPLGVNPQRFRPATVEERAARRAALHIAEGDLAVLFVGRFTPHAKAHPFPLFHGLSQAVKQSGRRAHLILAGWAPNESILRAFVDGARTLAPGIPVSLVNGMDPDWRFAVWQAADVFASPSDSIQETFGLVILEAMASGLPVIASDWDGYRDLVVDGQTGLLVPTYLLDGATADAAIRLLLQGSYDTFLAECNQTAIVDPAGAAAAFSRLLRDEALRRQMGAAGRQRVLEQFTWERVIRAYESLWQSQDQQRRECQAGRTRAQETGRGPACYPSPEVSFAGYPSRLLADTDSLEATPEAGGMLRLLLAMPLCNYVAERRLTDETVLRSLLELSATPRSVAELDEFLRRHGGERSRGRATLAWLLKYGLLQPTV